MLIHESRYENTPIMSLQTGSELARTSLPLVNPENLHIIAYEVTGQGLQTNPSILRVSDIREVSSIGFIVNDSDELLEPGDVIAIDRLREYRFNPMKMNVLTEDGKKLGTVEDFIIDTASFVIMQLQIQSPLLRRFANTSNLVHRSQIVEINDEAIIVRSAREKITPVSADKPSHDFVNPFAKHPEPTE